MKFRIHAFESFSRANGPGLRAVVWFQGCTLGCPGCFNPATHDPRGGDETDTETLANKVLAVGDQIEGVSISGGEPFQQAEALFDLLCRLADSRLSRLVFSGYSVPEIERLPFGPRVLRHVDVLIAGRFVEIRRSTRNLLASTNQEIHMLTARYTDSDLARVARRELVLHSDGGVTATGLAPWQPVLGRIGTPENRERE